MNWTNEVWNLLMQSLFIHWYLISWHDMVQIKEETANIWEYKVDINANNADIANFVQL